MPAKHQILVEGVNDQHVIGHLLRKHGLACELIPRGKKVTGEYGLVIRDAEGYENLLRSLEGRLTESFLERLAIIVDADASLVTRWESLRNRLIALGGIGLPTEPQQAGTFTTVRQTDRDIQVGIWLMPDNVASGRLETFAARLMRDDDVLWPHTLSIVSALPQRRFPEVATEKANIATWLAWQDTPGMRLGEAISKSLLDAHAVHAQQLVNWIKNLFDLV